ncbi:MAG: hypothetical protein VYE62_02330, partial [Pseudomonadota bacterium]|nr:hypothetical protein [Pseudomonadota bacterium]
NFSFAISPYLYIVPAAASIMFYPHNRGRAVPLNLPIHLSGAGEGNRTLVVSLEGFCSTIELHPLIVYQISFLIRYLPLYYTLP